MTSSEATALQARIAGIGGCAFLLGEAANARQLWEVPVLDAHCCREYFLGATLNESISLLHASILVWGPKPLPWRKTIGIILTVVFTKQMTITRRPSVSAVPHNSSGVQPEPRLAANSVDRTRIPRGATIGFPNDGRLPRTFGPALGETFARNRHVTSTAAHAVRIFRPQSLMKVSYTCFREKAS
jgi:hypothetical protein